MIKTSTLRRLALKRKDHFLTFVIRFLENIEWGNSFINCKSNFRKPSTAAVVLVAFCLLANVNSAKAQTPAYECNSCSASDVSIANVQLVSTTPNPAYQPNPALPNVNYEKYLPLSSVCTAGQPVFAFIKITVSQNAQERYGLHVEGNINIDGAFVTSFSSCDRSTFVSGGRDKFYVDATPISWECGTKLTLSRTFVGWGESEDKNACDDICKLGPHCNKPSASVTFTVVTPLSADFGISVPTCEPDKIAETYTFNALAATPDGTTGGTLPYTSFRWEIRNAADQIVKAESNTDASSLTYDFPAAGDYTVKLTVTDEDPSDPSKTITSTKTKNITVSSCCTHPANAGTDGTLTVCAGATPTNEQLFAALTGADEGGVWTGPVAGVYTYTVTALAPCTGTDQSTVTITEQPQPNAGTDGTLKICAGSTVTTSQLFNALKGTPTPGGSWLPTLAGAGTYTYTVAATSPCTVDATAQVVVTEQAQPNAGTDGALSVCAGTTPTNEQLFAALTGADAGGTWTHDGNVYTYTVIGTTPCTESDQSTVTVTFDPLPTASAGGSATICANGSKQISGATASNGTIMWTEDGAGSITSGETSLTPTYTAAAGDAGKTVTLTMTVTSNNTCGSATATATYTIAVTPLPSVSPLNNVTITYPANATFSTAIAGTTTSAAYWQEKIGLAAYTSLGSVPPYSISTLPNNASTSPTSSDLTITSPPVSWSGRNYRVNVNGCGITASSSALLTVNAAPLCLTYDGLMFGVTNSSKCYVDNGGKIRIILTVLGTPAGNLNTATVNVSVGAISNAATTYVPAANGSPAFFYYDWVVPCPAMASSANSETFEVTWEIGGNYTGKGCSETEALITLSAPSSDFTTGGGYILNNKSKGELGITQGEAPSKNNYGFNLKWGNNLKNLQGNFNTIIRQGGKQYQVKTNKPTYLSTKSLGSYTVNGKTYYPYEALMIYENAVYKDLTTGTSQGGGPNSIVYLRVVDNGEPNTGTPRIDQISILYKLNNTVIYSSEEYTATNSPSVLKLMDIVKGNIQVHVAGAKGSNQRSVDPAITSIAPESFNLKVLPNPSSSYFTVNITANSEEKMQVRVMDIMGRNIETLSNMAPNQSIRLGMQYRPGLYFVELTQGTKKQQVKLIKQ